MKPLILLFVLLVALAPAQDVPVGRLGFPLGTYLRIEGVRVDGPKFGTRTLLVDTIDGKKLDQPIGVTIENTDSLPKDTRCILRGYEMGRMIGNPPAVEQAAREENRMTTIPQFGWEFYRYFIVLSVVEPKSLQRR